MKWDWVPKGAIIGAQPYTVKKSDCLADACEVCDKENKVVWWEPGPNDEAVLIRLLHGFMHAIEEEYGVSIDDTVGNSDVDRIAQGMAQVFGAFMAQGDDE